LKFLKQELGKLKADGLYRDLLGAVQGIDFSSNDYLGLAKSSDFNVLFIAKVQTFSKQGSTGSRLLTGDSIEIQRLEAEIAEFHDGESALIYPSGYQANLGLLSSIASRGDTIIRDEYCHASTIDSLRLSFANVVKFKHNNTTDLEKKLIKSKGERFVVVESLYSMHGDISDLDAIISLCKKYKAHLIVDEAHTGGIYGSAGEGMVYERGLQNDVFARVMTYGKAFGYHGGAVIGSAYLINYLINKSRPFIYTTGVNFHQIAGLSVAYELIKQANGERKQLRDNVAYFSKLVANEKANWMKSSSQIQALFVPGNAAVMKQSNNLQMKQILAMPIRNPTVSAGTERIRVCLHAFNTKEEMNKLIGVVNE
tara:strand:+ start:1249 stop:2352 length:1104 start_codon:yes stop_codon:yes gene_type:complete